jgi:hypothetical protein
MLVSYRAPLGRLAEIPARESEDILLPPGRRRSADVVQRIQLHPRLDDEGLAAAVRMLLRLYGLASLPLR